MAHPPPDDGPSEPTRPLPLTSFGGRILWPALSPDGNQVAFVWNGEAGFLRPLRQARGPRDADPPDERAEPGELARLVTRRPPDRIPEEAGAGTLGPRRAPGARRQRADGRRGHARLGGSRGRRMEVALVVSQRGRESRPRPSAACRSPREK
ncbi:MAG: PD40 domain-containing protein [Holophagales bacterium]|nr:PD40 domain-containing protein [Holophagales bacterium]